MQVFRTGAQVTYLSSVHVADRFLEVARHRERGPKLSVLLLSKIRHIENRGVSGQMVEIDTGGRGRVGFRDVGDDGRLRLMRVRGRR